MSLADGTHLSSQEFARSSANLHLSLDVRFLSDKEGWVRKDTPLSRLAFPVA